MRATWNSNNTFIPEGFSSSNLISADEIRNSSSNENSDNYVMETIRSYVLGY